MQDNMTSCQASPVDDLNKTNKAQVNDWKLLFLWIFVSSSNAILPKTCIPTTP